MHGRLRARDIGLVINDADPYSVAVGAYYVQQRRLQTSQVLHVALPLRAALDGPEFATLAAQIRRFFGPRTQALALAWQWPYAVQCQSITGALALTTSRSFAARPARAPGCRRTSRRRACSRGAICSCGRRCCWRPAMSRRRRR